MPQRKSDLRRFYETVAFTAGHRCEYCLAPESFFNHRFTLDHVVPESRGGPSDPENLALCCYACQLSKLDAETGFDLAAETEAPLFNPRRQNWSHHFRWSADGVRIEGRSRIGWATIQRLAMNRPRQIEARRRWRRHPELFP